MITAGAYRNREFAGTECEFAWKNPDNRLSEFLPEESGEQTADALSELAAREDLVFDPQTSGGLLLSIDPADAHTAIQRLSTLSLPCAIIGKVTDLQKKHLIFVK